MGHRQQHLVRVGDHSVRSSSGSRTRIKRVVNTRPITLLGCYLDPNRGGSSCRSSDTPFDALRVDRSCYSRGRRVGRTSGRWEPFCSVLFPRLLRQSDNYQDEQTPRHAANSSLRRVLRLHRFGICGDQRSVVLQRSRILTFTWPDHSAYSDGAHHFGWSPIAKPRNCTSHLGRNGAKPTVRSLGRRGNNFR